MTDIIESNESKTHRVRFYAPVSAAEKILAFDCSLYESEMKRVFTGDENQKNVTIQFSTYNCGRVTANQRLIKILISSLNDN